MYAPSIINDSGHNLWFYWIIQQNVDLIRQLPHYAFSKALFCTRMRGIGALLSHRSQLDPQKDSLLLE